MDMNQYMEIFIDESKEHLQTMNEVLLELENNMSDVQHVAEIFRVAHTIKGMSGTMGFTKVADLTHEMENVLHLVRSQEIAVNSYIIDILFECFDSLESQITHIEENSIESDEENVSLVNKLKEIVRTKSNQPGDGPVEEKVTEEVKVVETSGEFHVDVFQTSVAALRKSVEDGYAIMKIRVTLAESCMLKAARAFIIFNALENMGEVLLSHPNAEDIEDENFDQAFEVLYITKSSEVEVRNMFDSISEIDRIDIEAVNELPEEIGEEKVEEVVEEILEEKVEEVKTDLGAQAKPSAKSKTSKTVRVDIDRLDNLMNLVSELIIVKTTMEDHDSTAGKSSMDDAVEYLERITTSLHNAVMKVRMVPVERVFNRFPRMVRDLAKDLDKKIKLIMSGQETEVDRTVVDEIADPLIHLIRNSIDHGIEAPAEREKRGKSAHGTVNLKAYPEGNNVVIEVVDDGNGIDPKKIAAKAVSKGLLTEKEVESMTEKEMLNLLFMPGFSTAEVVTDLSGRGVGLDVVKSKIASLGGSVDILSEVGEGSKFVIRLPLTLAIIQALMVYLDDEKYALPLNNISEITTIKSEDISMLQNQEVVLYRNKTLPIIRMKEVLELRDPSEREDVKELTVVIVRKGTEEAGLVVDSLIGQQEIVIKSLGSYLKGIPAIAGATILGNGGVALIVDPNQLF
ncbi:chemotaxis protein CheA [Acidaminobacter sp. JC074]|uniref:chemotaxis protein CheA n=1 Tax=Acidaminobacter sp. JC074 TaxID=2530199 RepID=UPI001F0D5A6A|nr:chemotaxis protein CheA [Acidaminobacter sp. JC074]